MRLHLLSLYECVSVIVSSGKVGGSLYVPVVCTWTFTQLSVGWGTVYPQTFTLGLHQEERRHRTTHSGRAPQN